MSLIDGLAQLVDNNGDGLLSLNIGGRSVNGDNFHANGLSRRSPLPGADHGPDVPPILLRRESISSLHESLIVARSAVGDHGEMLQVPQSEIQNVLDKLKALEDEVSALLDNDGQDEDATAPEDTEPPNVASKVSDGHPAPEADNDEDPAQEDSSAKKEPPAKEHDSKDYSDEDAEAG